MSDRTHPITVLIPEGDPQIVCIYENNTKEIPAGWANIFVRKNDTAVLMMIYVRQKYRGQGYAQELIKKIQDHFKRVITEYEKGIINSAGVRLCIKCGFVMKPSLFKNIPSELVWERAENA